MLLDILIVVASYVLLVEGQCSGTTTISTPAQATAVGQCGTFDGDVVVGYNATDDISLTGLTTITGDLTCSYGDELTSFRADDLVTIGERLSIRSNDVLRSVSFASLQNIDSLDLYRLPNLTNTGWKSQLANVTTVRIVGTGFTNLNWLTIPTVETLNIEDNSFLNDISLSVNVSEYTSLDSNGPTLRVSFPNMLIGYNLTISNCLEFHVPSLAYINRSAGFFGNAFEELSMPNLLSVGGALMIWNQSSLSSLDLPLLANVSGDILFNNNPKLESIELPQLGIVKGDIMINDSMTSVLMPSLNLVQGDVDVNSTLSLDCSSLDPYDVSDVFQGLYHCIGTNVTSTGSSSPDDTSSSSGSTSGSSTLSGGAKGGIAAGVIIGVLLLLAGGFFLWRRRRRARLTSTNPVSETANVDHNAPTNSTGFTEEDGAAKPAELDATRDKTTGVAELAGSKSQPDKSELEGSNNTGSTIAELSGEKSQPDTSELEGSKTGHLNVAELPAQKH